MIFSLSGARLVATEMNVREMKAASSGQRNAYVLP
jgi:hypothetical protein